ncbi:MAG: hypothetical protein IIC21_05970 [Chloroflexi bacterium]|nr:hypothetical protein [Chloroflexota bacterium]
MSRTKIVFLLGFLLLIIASVVVAQTQVPVSADLDEGEGSAVISDGQGLSDRITYTMTGMSNLGPDQAYEGWLVNSSTGDLVSTGVMNSPVGNINHVWDSPDGTNLIAEYDTVVISIEPVPDPDPGSPSDTKPFSHTIPDGAMVHIRHLLVSWPGGEPNGILQNLRLQLDSALESVGDARSATSMAELQSAIQSVVDTIDADDGVLVHAADRKHGPFAADASGGDATVVNNAALVDEFGANAEAWANEAKESAADVLGQSSLAIAKTLVNTVSGRLDAARNGISATGDGGAEQAYVQAQMMAEYQLGGEVATVAVGTPSVGDTSVPIFAAIALLGSLLLLSTGGVLFYRGRRTREIKA